VQGNWGTIGLNVKKQYTCHYMVLEEECASSKHRDAEKTQTFPHAAMHALHGVEG